MTSLARKQQHQYSATDRNAIPTLELVGTMRKRVKSLRLNRQLRKLLHYDDRMLSDIGYSRADLQRTLRTPRFSGMESAVGNIHLQDLHPKQYRVRH